MRMAEWTFYHPRMTMEMLGLIPGWLSEDNPDRVRDQIDQNYGHGGGWRPFEGFKMTEGYALIYTGDPPLRPLASTLVREELVLFYDCAWLAIVQPDKSFEVARVD